MSKRKIKIAFISPKRYSFDPQDYLNRGLGGSESALVLMSNALAKRGHVVYVYNCCFKPGNYNGVLWKPIWSFSRNEKFDVVISLRLLETYEQSVNASLRAVWIHDDSLNGAEELDKSHLVNMWIAVSKTQQACIEKEESINRSHWFVTRNGLDTDLYKKLQKKEKKRGQLIYCSAPDRGLKHLLDYWPIIKKKVPFASLIVTGSFALWGNTDEENDRLFRTLYRNNNALKDVQMYKRVKKQELAILQAESELMLYPTTFDEMFCISALECLSIGTPVITTARGAMLERVIDSKNGYLIKGDPSSPKYKNQFISNTVFLLNNPDVRNKMAENAKELSKSFGYECIAIEWENEFLKRLSKKRGDNK